MPYYIAKRVFQAVLVLLLVTVITFLLMHTVPGSPFLSEKASSAATQAAQRAKYGLDKPLTVQLTTYIENALKLDFGVSLKMQKNRPVIEIIKEMFPVSAKIGLIALVVAIIIGIPIGSIAAFNRGNKIDSFLRIFTTLGISVPGFVTATVLLVLFGVKWNILPTSGLDTAKGYIMPVFSMAFYPMCYIGRLSRASMLDVINQDYIRTAKAKGVNSTKIVFKHALRNAFIPVLTYLGPLTAGIIVGSLVVEKVFSIPGLGRYYVQSVLNRDYPLIMATTIFFAALLVSMNLVVDILYKFVDPRIDITKGNK